MTPILQRKTVLILTLAASLAATLIILATDEQLREQLGTRYWLLGLAIVGCVLLVLAGYIWDRSTVERLREIKRTADTPASEFSSAAETHIDADADEIMGLACQIERMARSLQRVEASYRAVIEAQVDLICRYRAELLRKSAPLDASTTRRRSRWSFGNSSPCWALTTTLKRTHEPRCRREPPGRLWAGQTRPWPDCWPSLVDGP